MYLEDEYNKAVEKAYQKGASDMEKAKQIIIDKLLVDREQITAEVIEEFLNQIEKQTTFYCGKDSKLRQIAEQLKGE